MAKAQPKRGRPKGDPAENLSQLVTFRLTDAEFEQSIIAAAKAERSLREWMRLVVAKAATKALKGR